MRIEKFEDLAVAIDDEMAIWFRVEDDGKSMNAVSDLLNLR